MVRPKHIRAILRNAQADAAGSGLAIEVESYRGHHFVILRSPSGAKRRWTIPGTPRDADYCVHNIRAPIRRLIEELRA